MTDWKVPEGHPISFEKAKELFAGPLADVYRDILRESCAPIYWYHCGTGAIENNGTVTFIRTPSCLLGVTAAHVMRGYFSDARDSRINLQIADSLINDMSARIVDINDRLDIATFSVDEHFLKRLGKKITPLSNWPPQSPQEGRGIMLAGYPGQEVLRGSNNLNFGLFTALVIARTVTDIQITWLIERDAQLPSAKITAPPINYGLGGVSGGPLITWLESENHIATFVLGGIIIEHPDYKASDISIERVIAVRADFISQSGRITG